MNSLFLDDERKLDQLLFAFLADPNNAHHFPRNSSDQEDLEVPESPPLEKTDKSVKYFLLTLRLYQVSNFTFARYRLHEVDLEQVFA